MKMYAKNGGAARRRFSAIRDKPGGVVKMSPYQGDQGMNTNDIHQNHWQSHVSLPKSHALLHLSSQNKKQSKRTCSKTCFLYRLVSEKEAQSNNAFIFCDSHQTRPDPLELKSSSPDKHGSLDPTVADLVSLL